MEREDGGARARLLKFAVAKLPTEMVEANLQRVDLLLEVRRQCEDSATRGMNGQKILIDIIDDDHRRRIRR